MSKMSRDGAYRRSSATESPIAPIGLTIINSYLCFEKIGKAIMRVFYFSV
jgi:hypothetical protein